jgi:hypothetical protein
LHCPVVAALNIRHADMPSIHVGPMPKPMMRRVKMSMTSSTPMAAQDDRFNAKQIDTPDAVFCLSDDGQPGRTIGIRLGSRVYGEHASHDIFVDLNAKGVSDLLGDADTTELRVVVLHLDDGRDELLGWALRARSFVSGTKRRPAGDIFDGPRPRGI